MSRPLTEVLEELCPGVAQRNRPAWARLCETCRLDWIHCRCEIYRPKDFAQTPYTDEEDEDALMEQQR